MNVEIGAEAVQFPEKEYINGIAVVVYLKILQFFVEIPRKLKQICFLIRKQGLSLLLYCITFAKYT